jgi:4-hydroxybenzoate polyprenyltransferase
LTSSRLSSPLYTGSWNDDRAVTAILPGVERGVARAPNGHAAAYPLALEGQGRLRALMRALRPLQWSKNLLLFAGLVFAGEFGDAGQWARALAVFVAYCAASSAAYLVNDVRDAGDDRAHPIKRRRPVAAGDLSGAVALAAAALLAASALGICLALGRTSALLLLVFLLLQAGYTFGLKRAPGIDVLAIAGLFVVRAAAGAEAIHVRISPWLLVCTALLALLLALGKRRAELGLVEAGRTPGRNVLGSYRPQTLDRAIAVTLAATVVAYAVYAVTWESAWMLLTVPFVLAGLWRYARLVRRWQAEEPETLLVSDPVLLGTVGLWVLASAAVVGVA